MGRCWPWRSWTAMRRESALDLFFVWENGGNWRKIEESFGKTLFFVLNPWKTDPSLLLPSQGEGGVAWFGASQLL